MHKQIGDLFFSSDSWSFLRSHIALSYDVIWVCWKSCHWQCSWWKAWAQADWLGNKFCCIPNTYNAFKGRPKIINCKYKVNIYSKNSVKGLIIFLLLNMKLMPFTFQALNDMEMLSILTWMLTIYWGIFFLSDMPEIYNSEDSTIKEADNGCKFIYIIIM